MAVEPYFGGSHRHFLDGLARHSRHRIEIIGLPARYWKWRMHGGAVTLAMEAQSLGRSFDLIFASEMLNLPNFLSLARRRFGGTPVIVYFHENQATYPMPPFEKRDLTYAYINWAGLLAADQAWFNSSYHLEQFFDELPRLLKHFPDYQNLDSIAPARAKSLVMEPGCDLEALDRHRIPKSSTPRVLWNHRWEYDKGPEAFFRALSAAREAGARFELVLAGRNYRREPSEFIKARERFRGELVHYGYAVSLRDYARLLWSSHIAVSTARHEFFGIAAVEAMNCCCHPLLPDRLNYPSLAAPEFLYSDEGALADRLVELSGNTASLEGGKARRQVARLDWSERAPIFDRAFERAAGKSR